MKIYISFDQSERGPYTKPEVFALLKDGTVTMDSPARLEEETEYSPLSEVLKQEAKRLFTVAEIEQHQIENAIESSIPIVPSPDRIPRETPVPASRPSHRVPILAGVLALAVSGAALMLLRQPDEPPPVVVETSSETLELAAAEPLPTPKPSSKKTVRASKPSPTPEQRIEVADLPPTPGPAEEAAKQNAIPTPPPVALEPKPASPEPSYAKVDLPGTEEGGNSQIWAATFSEKPSGVILLCIEGPIVTDKPPMRNWTDWKALAQKNNMVLAITGFHEKESNSAAILEFGLKQLHIENLPTLIYGVGPGGRLMADFATSHPDTVKGWASFDNQASPDPQKNVGRPVLLITDYETSKITDLKQRFEEARGNKQRWTLLTMASDPKKRRDDAGAFVRSYFQALIDFRGQGDQWVSVERVEQADTVDMAQTPEKVAWLPSQGLFESWKALMPKTEQTFDPVVRKKVVNTNVPQQPELTMFLRLPPQHKGMKTPNGILAFATWTQDSDTIEKQLLYRTDMKQLDAPGPAGITARLVRYAEKHNLAILTWTSRRFWRNDANSWELPKEQLQKVDRAFDRIAIGWEQGLEELLKGTDIPDTDMLLYGISRGAMWSQRLAVRMSHHFLATHLHVPISFDTPTDKANRMLWLITTGESDPGYEHCISFYEKSRGLHYPIIFKAFMNSGHGDNPKAQSLGFHFFDYALSLRDQRQAAAAKESNPLKKEQILKTAVWTAGFTKPPFIGDFLNQEMFPLSEVEMIPDGLRVPIPSEQLADAWNK